MQHRRHEEQHSYVFTARSLVPRYTGPAEETLTKEQATIRQSILESRPRTGLNGPFGPWLSVPAIARPAQTLGQACRYGTSLSFRESELVILLTGAKMRSDAEFDIHVGEARRAGWPDAVMLAIPRGDDFSLAAVREKVVPLLTTNGNNSSSREDTRSAREIAIALFAAELLDTCTVSDDTYATTKLALGNQDSVLVEITSIVGYYTLVSFTLNVFQIPSAPSSTMEHDAKATLPSSAADAAGTRQGLTDGGSEPHHPKLYQHDQQPDTVFAMASMNDLEPQLEAMVGAYNRDGYIVLDASLFQSHIPAISAALNNLVNGANLEFSHAVQAVVDSGTTPKFTSGCKIPWIQYEAGTKLQRDTTDSSFESLLLTPYVASMARKLMGFVGYEPAIDAIVSNVVLWTIVARLLDCSADTTTSTMDKVQLFQDMALLKPAGGGREKPWHQDKAYFDLSLESRVVGCWMAVDEATLDNGCLRMARGGHLQGPRPHFAVRDYQLCDTEALATKHDIVAIPLPPGALVLFDGLIPHGTPTNTSPNPRRALQFHWYNADGAVLVGENEPHIGRAHVFGGASQGLSC
jgi:alkylhydroperoxidase family enzyme